MFEKMAKEKAQTDAKESILNVRNLLDQVGKLQQSERMLEAELKKGKDLLEDQRFEN